MPAPGCSAAGTGVRLCRIRKVHSVNSLEELLWPHQAGLEGDKDMPSENS